MKKHVKRKPSARRRGASGALQGVPNSDGVPSGYQSSRARLNAIHDEIRNRICLLQYPPGTTLREAALGKEFGVSRTPIRQVLQRLEMDGLVETRDGVGTIVTELDPNQFRDIYEMRMKTIELIGEMNPRPCSEVNISALEELLKAVRKLRKTRDFDAFGRLNHVYHNELGQLIGNHALRRLYDLFYYQTARFWFRLVPKTWEIEVDGMCSELAEVIRALRAGDVRGAAYVRRNYIAMGMTLVSAHLTE